MKLIGSLLEDSYRESLVDSNKLLRSPDSMLRQALESNGFNTLNAYVLNCIPDDLDEIYLVLIDGSFLVKIEIDTFEQNEAPAFERIELNDYLRGLSKTNQVQLAVAMALASTKA